MRIVALAEAAVVVAAAVAAVVATTAAVAEIAGRFRDAEFRDAEIKRRGDAERSFALANYHRVTASPSLCVAKYSQSILPSKLARFTTISSIADVLAPGSFTPFTTIEKTSSSPAAVRTYPESAET